MKKLAMLAAAAIPGAASAFLDPFDGDSLGPHWSTYSEGSGWVHAVGAGALRVTELNGPFDFDEFNIFASVEGYADFAAEARVMWDTGTHQTLSFGVAQEFPQSPIIGVVRYQIAPGSTAQVSAVVHSGGSASLDAPAANEWHLLRLVRAGSTLEAFVDGALIASTHAAVGDTASRVFLHFGGPETSAFGEFRVDYVSVVPEPASLLALGSGCLLLLRRRAAARPKVKKSLGEP